MNADARHGDAGRLERREQSVKSELMEAEKRGEGMLQQIFCLPFHAREEVKSESSGSPLSKTS